MRRLTLSTEACKKAAVLLRDHSLAQIRNAASYSWQAWRRFPSASVAHSPVWLDVLVTARCNLRCRHCSFFAAGENRQPRSFRDISLDTYLQILDRYPSAMSIVLAGGEPLLHPALIEMIHAAHARRLKVHIPTNGVLLHRFADQLLEAPVQMLNVSLYGTDLADFAQVTGCRADLFGETVGGMREILRRRRQYPRIFRASYLCTKANLSRVADFIRLCEDIGVDQVKLKNLTPVGVQGCGEAAPLREEDRAVQRVIEELSTLRFSIPVYLPRLYRRQYPRPSCTMPFRFLTIDADGCIGPCCVIGTDPRHGNIFTDKDIWNGPAMLEARRILTDPSSPLPELCLNCEEMIPDRRRL